MCVCVVYGCVLLYVRGGLDGVGWKKSLLYPVACLHRSGDYGVSFTNIESTMDPADRNPVLWRIFYTNPKNKNFVRKTFRTYQYCDTDQSTKV